MAGKLTYEELEKKVQVLQKENESLVESEANLMSLLENSPDYFALLDKKFNIQFINRPLPEQTKDQVIGKSFFDVIPDNDHDVWMNCFESTLKTGTPEQYESGYYIQEGVYRDFEARVGPVIRKDRVDGLALSFTDITERKKAAAELKESEEKYRNLFDNAGDLITVVDKEGIVLDINKQFEIESGYSRDMILGKNVFTVEMLTDASVEKIRDRLIKALEENQWEKFEVEGIKKDGGTVFFEVRAVPIEKNGEIVAIQAALRNISERKKTETALRESEEKFKMIFENANDEILFVDTEGTMLDVNDKVIDIFGYTPEEVLGKNFAEFNFLVPEALEKMVSLFEEVIAGRDLPMQEFEAIRKDGSKVLIEGNSRVVKKDGKILGILNIIRDVTERKKTEKELRDSEEKFKSIFENINDAIVYLSEDGTFVEVNERIKEIFGYTRDEVIGKNFMEFNFMSPAAMEKMVKLFNDVVAGKVTPMQEFEFLKKDGTSIFVEGNSRLIKKDGEIIGLLNVLRDITDRKMADLELQKREQELEVKSLKLEDANTALSVMLKKRDEEKTEIEEKILVNVKELVMPFVEELKLGQLNERQENFVKIIEGNLNEIISPFVRRLSSKFISLTPTEIRIANLIKQGRATKEIAEMFKMHPRTIDLHRYNIRKKLGINKSKANLMTHLLTLE